MLGSYAAPDHRGSLSSKEGLYRYSRSLGQEPSLQVAWVISLSASQQSAIAEEVKCPCILF